MSKQLTPMLQQYFDIKKEYSDCILFFRMGDFYEMFGDDAITASDILEITLTARQKGTKNEIPMCGIPHHAANGYIGKLTQAGKKVAICEQISDPKLPGLVERKVKRVITPGTALDDDILDSKTNNFLVGIYTNKQHYGFGLIDVSTGDFYAGELHWQEIELELARIEPREIIVDSLLFEDSVKRKSLEQFAAVHQFTLSVYTEADDLLKTHFKVPSLDGFGMAQLPAAIISAGHLLGYIQETQKSALEHINSISVFNKKNYMVLDNVTLRNLDVLYNSFDGSKDNSLLSVLDSTVTSMGGRLLRQWLLQPLVNKQSIEERLDFVEFFVEHITITDELRGLLKQIGDLQRLIGRIGCGRTHARDIMYLKNSLDVIPQLKDVLGENTDQHIRTLANTLDTCDDLRVLIEDALQDDLPITITEGGMIRTGYHTELDELRSMSISGKDFIRNLQAREIEQTGISTLKVKFNKVFGYYIEITNSHLEKVPEHYIRKQTLVNAERFIIPELKEYEQKILTAEDKMKEIEYKLFLELIEKIKPFFEVIQKNAQLVAALDIYVGLAFNAYTYKYCKPTINENGIINIQQGRHPVIEQSDVVDDYMPNDSFLNHDDHQLLLLTGPNMAGKSSFLRQTALITLMAHIGSFVPAQTADISLVDRIFTRVGASDNVSRGQSTFMVEMQEAANILHNATEKSLVILDEIGRGTSTYDGLSIAWAITEYIYHNVQAKTLFATHYHELIQVIDELSKAQNYAMAVKELDDGVLFLHQVERGGCNRSYGIDVAKLAGMPAGVVDAAREFLSALESKKDTALQPSLFDIRPVVPQKVITQETDPKYQEVYNTIKYLDLNSMTPLEVMAEIDRIQRDIK